MEQIHIHYGDNNVRQVWVYKPENRIVGSTAQLDEGAERWLDWREILELAKTDKNLNDLIEQIEVIYYLKK